MRKRLFFRQGSSLLLYLCRGTGYRRYSPQCFQSDIIVVTVKEAIPHAKVKKGDVLNAVVVRTVAPLSRPEDTLVKFDENAAVLLTTGGDPIGTRIFGPVARELRSLGFMKIISLAPEVL